MNKEQKNGNKFEYLKIFKTLKINDFTKDFCFFWRLSKEDLHLTSNQLPRALIE